MSKTDLIIIGAGPGGYRAAEYAAKQGLKVVIFESGDVGGTCLNVGCIPTKIYVHSADFAMARQRVPQVVQQLRRGVEDILTHPNITLVRAEAHFLNAHTVEADGVEYSAVNIIIATGSVPKTLSLECVEGTVLDSSDLLQMGHLPKSLCIVGAGVIGMEFASIFSGFGTEVTVVEYLRECLPTLDSDIAKRLRKTFRGVTFCMQCAVKSIENGVVTYEDKKGHTYTIEADEVLMAVGRAPRVQPDFAYAGFVFDEHNGISVDDNFQTTLPHIYAIGDVNNRMMLAHAAEMQAVRAVNHILGRSDGIRFDIMPAAVFTRPEAACVGLSEDQLKAKGVPYVCKKSFWRANGKALAMNETEGMLKLFFSPLEPAEAEKGQDMFKGNKMIPGKILGCHAFGAHAADIVQTVSALMCKDTTVSELADMIHIHPTLSELLKSAADN